MTALPDATVGLRLTLGGGEATVEFRLTEDAIALASGEVSRTDAFALTRRWTRLRRSTPRDESTVHGFGGELAALLPLDVLGAIVERVGVALAERKTVRLAIDASLPEFGDLPWEWLNVPRMSGFQSIEGVLALVPHVRVVRDPSAPIPDFPQSGLRVLLTTADPGTAGFPHLPWLGAEIRAIESAFAAARRPNVEVRVLSSALPSALETALADFRPHLLHFAGHGETRPGGGVLALQGPAAHTERLVSGPVLASWLAAAGTQMAFLSACDTAGSSHAMARALLDAGVPAIVAMQTPASDAAQPHFARVFYGALLDGAPLEEAAAEARQAVAGAAEAWTSPVLYASESTGSLFEARRSADRSRTPNNLPCFEAPLVGRERELDAIVRESRASRLLCLVGPGGIGKTRLAVEAATERLEEFPGGVWTLTGDVGTQAHDVLFAVARAVGAAIDGEPTAALEERFRDGATLLVLDGLEGLVAAGDLQAIETLRSFPTVSILATSRFRLGLPDEAVFEVGPLGPDQGRGQALFLHEARRSRSSLSDDEARDVARICERLEGVPLALVVAAGRLRFVDLATLESLLRESALSTLGGPGSGVGGAIRRSLDLVPEEDLARLRELAVFAGAFSWDDAAAVYPERRFDLLEGLSRLADQSLLQPEGDASAHRFRILDSLREYLDTLPFGEDVRSQIRAGKARHLDLFVARAREIARLMGEGQWSRATHSLWDALPNLRLALIFAVENERVSETETLCRSLILTLMEAGMRADFEAFAQAGRMVAAANGDRQLESYVLSLEGAMKSRRGDSRGAEKAWIARAELGKRFGNSAAAADSMIDLATQCIADGDLERARGWLDEAMPEARRADRADVYALHATVESIYWDREGDPARAAEAARAAERYLADVDSADIQYFVYSNLARAWRSQNDLRRVRLAMERVLRGALSAERRTQSAVALGEIAEVLEAMGLLEAAARCRVGVVAILKELGSPRARRAERDLEAFRLAHPDLDALRAEPTGRWSDHAYAALEFLSALNREESRGESRDPSR